MGEFLAEHQIGKLS